MPIACSTSAFKMPLVEVLVEIKELRFTHVDLICIKGFGHIIPAEVASDWKAYAQDVETMLEANHLTPVALNMAVANPYQREDETVNAQRLKELEALARLMNRLDVRIASFFPGGNWPAQERPWEDVLRDEVETIREMLSVAADYQVTFAVELHANTPFETVAQGTRLLEAVPELKVAFDPSHFAMQGVDLCETTLFLDRTVHVHMRDAGPNEMIMPLGQGTVDFEWLVSALKERGYEGSYSIEVLPKLDGSVREEIRRLRDRVRTCLG